MRVLFLTAVLIIAGCQTTPRNIGPINVALGPGASAGWKQYKTLSKPDFFAVSEDGLAYGYTFCGVAGCLNDPMSYRRRRAIKHCRKNSGGVPCRVFAAQTKVIWDGNVRFDAQPVVADNAVEVLRRGKEKTALFRWPGLVDEAVGVVVLTGGRGRTGGAIAVLPDPIGRCAITLNFKSRSEGAWTAACAADLTATGAFAAAEDGKVAIGKGVDQRGREVWFKFGPK